MITNATGFDRPEVRDGLRFMDEHQGEVWAKLDAGTAEYFKLIDYTDFPFEKVLENIQWCARLRPIVIQSCFMRVCGEGPSSEEIQAFVMRLNEIARSGGRISRVQVYTVARPPSYGKVSSLSNEEVDQITRCVISESGLRAVSYYGEVEEGQGWLGHELPE